MNRMRRNLTFALTVMMLGGLAHAIELMVILLAALHAKSYASLSLSTATAISLRQGSEK